MFYSEGEMTNLDLNVFLYFSLFHVTLNHLCSLSAAGLSLKMPL